MRILENAMGTKVGLWVRIVEMACAIAGLCSGWSFGGWSAIMA